MSINMRSCMRPSATFVGIRCGHSIVFDGELSSHVPADGYFSFIVLADSLLGRWQRLSGMKMTNAIFMPVS